MMERCSFCGKPKGEVERLIQGGGEHASLPIVFICGDCVAQCTHTIGIIEPKGDASPERLKGWAHVEVDGEVYRWSAVRTRVIREVPGKGSQRERIVMIRVGKIGEPASGVMHPDGTEPTEHLAIAAVRALRLQGRGGE
jgi:ClpX C4-type zinc finger